VSALAEVAAFGYGLASMVEPRLPSPTRFRWSDRSLVALMVGSLAGGWINVRSEAREISQTEARRRHEEAVAGRVRRAADLLGIGIHADRITIKRAFRVAVRRVHPDLHGVDGDAGAVSRLAWARDVMLAALGGALL
jgi:hypothetical protein